MSTCRLVGLSLPNYFIIFILFLKNRKQVAKNENTKERKTETKLNRIENPNPQEIDEFLKECRSNTIQSMKPKTGQKMKQQTIIEVLKNQETEEEENLVKRNESIANKGKEEAKQKNEKTEENLVKMNLVNKDNKEEKQECEK